jgi:hypothetical protein
MASPENTTAINIAAQSAAIGDPNLFHLLMTNSPPTCLLSPALVAFARLTIPIVRHV